MKLDLGCGTKCRPGFIGVDVRPFPGVEVVCDLAARETIVQCGFAHEGEPLIVDGNRLQPIMPSHRTIERFKPWPWADNSIEEAYASHFVEHLDAPARIHFVNELYRILVPGGTATIITPHWCSNRAYGDLTHVFPPVAESWYYYLGRAWREREAPHSDFYTCDFDVKWSYIGHAGIEPGQENFAINWHKEAAQDMVAVLTRR